MAADPYESVTPEVESLCSPWRHRWGPLEHTVHSNAHGRAFLSPNHYRLCSECSWLKFIEFCGCDDMLREEMLAYATAQEIRLISAG